MKKSKSIIYLLIIAAILIVSGFSFARYFRYGVDISLLTASAEENTSGTENADDRADEGGTSGIREGVGRLNQAVANVERKISILASNGVSRDVFSNRLEEIKRSLAEAESELLFNPASSKAKSDYAEKKYSQLEALVEMALKYDDQDADSAEEAQEEIEELRGDIAELDAFLARAEAKGADIRSLRANFEGAKALLVQAEQKYSAKSFIEAEAIAELAGKKLDKIDDSIRSLFKGNYGYIPEEYKNETALFARYLEQIAGLEGEAGQPLIAMAEDQIGSEVKLANSIAVLDRRSPLKKFFIGPDFKEVASIRTVISENQTRIKILTDIMNPVEDPAVKFVLQDQITHLGQQNANLDKYARERAGGFSLLGWLMKLFA